VAFKALTPEIIRLVVHKFVLQLEAQLADRHVTVELSDDAADWLAKNGFDELYGARPLARVIQEHIKKPLADEILFGNLVRGGHVRVTLKDGKLAFGFDSASGAPAPSGDDADPELAEVGVGEPAAPVSAESGKSEPTKVAAKKSSKPAVPERSA